MPEPTHTKIPTTTTDELEISDEMRENLERMQGYYKKTMSDTLQELYNSGKTEDLNEAVEDIAYDIMLQVDPEYNELLGQRRSNPNAPITERVLQIAESYKKFIIAEAGLPDEARFTEIEQARDTVAAKILETIGHEPDNTQDALIALGIVTHDDEGTAHYSFPEELVPESVNEKWRTYLAAVCAHLKAADELKTTGDMKNVEEKDDVRTFAHDSVTRDVHAILGLEGIQGWDYKNTRQLLASIREEVFPTLGSIKSSPEEIHRSEELMNQCDRQLNIAGRLSKK